MPTPTLSKEVIEITTYPEMNKSVIELLILAGDNYSLYAAKRLIELEEQQQSLIEALELFTMLDENHYMDIAGLISNAKEKIEQYTHSLNIK